MVFLTSGVAIWSIIRLILVLILVLILAYVATKYIAKYQSSNLGYKNNIKVIESFRLGGNKFISIIKIGEDYYALGFGKEEITLIDKLDAERLLLKSEDDSDTQKREFKDILASFKKNNSNDNNDSE